MEINGFIGIIGAIVIILGAIIWGVSGSVQGLEDRLFNLEQQRKHDRELYDEKRIEKLRVAYGGVPKTRKISELPVTQPFNFQQSWGALVKHSDSLADQLNTVSRELQEKKTLVIDMTKELFEMNEILEANEKGLANMAELNVKSATELEKTVKKNRKLQTVIDQLYEKLRNRPIELMPKDRIKTGLVNDKPFIVEEFIERLENTQPFDTNECQQCEGSGRIEFNECPYCFDGIAPTGQNALKYDKPPQTESTPTKT